MKSASSKEIQVLQITPKEQAVVVMIQSSKGSFVDTMQRLVKSEEQLEDDVRE